jgi:hypothetical protein
LRSFHALSISGSDRARPNPPHARIARAFPPSATAEGARRFEHDNEDRWIEARGWDPRGWQGEREGSREKADREREREREGRGRREKRDRATEFRAAVTMRVIDRARLRDRPEM